MHTIRFFLLLGLMLSAPALFAQVDRSKAPEPGPNPRINLGSYEAFTLENGLKVFVVENHKLPRLSFNLHLEYDPFTEGDAVGYVSMAGDLLRRGTENRSKEAIDEEIDLMGAWLGTSPTGITASCLKKHHERLLEVMTDILYHPAFPETELEKLKTQTLSALASAKDDADAISENVGNVLRYGRTHPYGEVTTEETVKKITAEKCREFYRKYFRPNIAYLAIVGDITPEEAKALSEKFFSSWTAGAEHGIRNRKPQAPEKTRVCLVDKAAAVQSAITVTYPVDITPGHQDAIKVRVMNDILGGGGFSGRLMQNLREDKAYTYGAYSRLSHDKLIGSFSAFAKVRNEVTDSAITEILKEMNRMREEEVDAEVVKATIQKITGSFARSLEQPQTIAGFALNKEIYHLADDYYETYLQKLEKVTAQDVQAMAQKYLKPDQAYILVVGNRNAVKEKLVPFAAGGKVELYDHNGNEIRDLKPLPEGLTAQAVIDQYLLAMTGQTKMKKAIKAISKVKDVTVRASVELRGTSFELVTYQKAPDKFAMTFGNETMTFQEQTFDGEKGMMKSMQGSEEVTGERLQELKYASLLHPEPRYAELGFKLDLTGIETYEGKDYYIVEITDPAGNKETAFFDSETHLKARSVSLQKTPMGDFNRTTDYSDFKEVNSVLFAHTIRQNFGPQVLEMKVTAIKVNTDLPDATFRID